MKRIKKITCPVDFSEISDEALEIAVQLAEKNSSSFQLLYVLPRPNYYDWTLSGMSNVVLDDYFDKTKKEVEAKKAATDALLEEMGKQRLEAETQQGPRSTIHQIYALLL